ncbi:Tc toxin subunit A [Pseudomonas sp. NPDC089752]|uniref:Tc toxin subunit A n=1 Tax=Pseudomonas sp. NPDC089752 TaxID=3364472 RepID=UPI00380034E6
MAEDQDGKQGMLLEKILAVEPAISSKLGATAFLSEPIAKLQREPARHLLKRYPELHFKEAQRLKARLQVATAAMMRAFREKRLVASSGRVADQLKGLLAQTDGPTFENQFFPDWGANTRPDALDATTSPVAYLIDILLFIAEYVERYADPHKALTLSTRRPDIYALLLDESAMNRVVTQVEVIIGMMERVIAEHQRVSNDTEVAEDKLLNVRHPLKLFPYELYWQQIKTVLSHNKLLISDVSRLSDMDAPYFIQLGAHSKWSDVALQQDTELGPALRAILIERAYFRGNALGRYDPQTRRWRVPPVSNPPDELADSTNFYQENFGVSGYPALQRVVNFCQALQFDQQEMDSLFGFAAHAPKLSSNITEPVPLDTPVSAKLFAARFINSGAEPAISVFTENDVHQFRNLTEDRCDRINRLVRLAHALDLPYAQADQLVCAIIEAEHRAPSVAARMTADAPLWMTVNTLRGLGLFQDLRARYACQPEVFSVFLSKMSVFGVGDTPSHFDRVFNADTSTPLVLDGAAFSVAGGDAASKRTVDQLCSGLGINMETFRYLARMVMQGQGSTTMRRSLDTISALYRVTALAQLLSITTIELLSLLEVLSPQGQYAILLAGAPQNTMYQSYEQADTISVIHAISSCVRWCQERDLAIVWLVKQLLPIESIELVQQHIRTLFTDLKSHLIPFQDFNRTLAEAGVTALRSQDWQTNLEQVVDAQGLIKDTGNSEEDFDALQYENFVQRETQVVIDRLISAGDDPESELPALSPDEVERLKILIVGCVLRLRSQQWGVVQERLAQFLSINADVSIPVIYWAGEMVHTLLASAASFDPDQIQSDTIKAITPFIYRLQRCALVARKFSLSPAFFSTLLMRALRPCLSIKTTELTLHTLYFLERYSQCLLLGQQSEEQLLGYFALISNLHELSENEKPLIRDAAAEKVAAWAGWGIREVLDVAKQISDDGIIANVQQLSILLQTRQLSEQTGLSADSLMKISRLSSHDDTRTYRAAAEEMLSSLRRETEQRRDEAELRQSLTSQCRVSKALLVANKHINDEDEDGEGTVTLKLLDMDNQPVSGIKVTWDTDLGTLLDRFSFTDHAGEAKVQIRAWFEKNENKRQALGVAHVTATYLLDSRAYAPPITFDCDEKTVDALGLIEKPEEPWLLAGNQGTYVLTTSLGDHNGNPGVDRLVKWATTIGYFLDSAGETLTDASGNSTIKLRSLAPGTGQVSYWYEPKSKDPVYFNIGFNDRPYVNTLDLISWVVAGWHIEVEATILRLDGEPSAGTALKWQCDGVKLVEGDEVSDSQGHARASFYTSEAAMASVTVTLTHLGEEKPYNTKTLEFEVLKDANKIESEESGRWPMADGISASEYEVHVFSSDDKPVAHYPITWKVQEGGYKDIVNLTGLDGIARYQLKSKEPRELTVAAVTLNGGGKTFDPVKFLPPLGLQVLFDGELVDGPITISQEDDASGVPHTLTYRIAEDHPLLEESMSLVYSSRDSALSLGLKFDPALGSGNSFADGEVTWTITASATGLRQPAGLRLGLSFAKAIDPIWTDAIVKPMGN